MKYFFVKSADHLERISFESSILSGWEICLSVRAKGQTVQKRRVWLSAFYFILFYEDKNLTFPAVFFFHKEIKRKRSSGWFGYVWKSLPSWHPSLCFPLLVEQQFRLTKHSTLSATLHIVARKQKSGMHRWDMFIFLEWRSTQGIWTTWVWKSAMTADFHTQVVKLS